MYQVREIKNEGTDYAILANTSYDKALEAVTKLRDDDSTLYITYDHNENYKLHCVRYIERMYNKLYTYTDLIHTSIKGV